MVFSLSSKWFLETNLRQHGKTNICFPKKKVDEVIDKWEIWKSFKQFFFFHRIKVETLPLSKLGSHKLMENEPWTL